ncbi:ATP-binding cassette domain-containing protein [Nakamurella sp. YIM 132087]|uniref:ATP-binding cassette domain-containing protein n=1 Tax=Nakamurella alba TaxID=2665158 RepID=A0A7K1FIF6_9ACTN|nr:ATP-binding cassette domain-containing protein [Nakamurella alba]MTD13901.1 ATP-binding cassette domain-containing protein [Nakamurella alba]
MGRFGAGVLGRRDTGVLPDGPAVLACTGLSRSFGGVHALRGVDLELDPGRTLAIIGPNGAGKSSLINVLTGLYAPSSGTVTLDGTDLRRTSMADRTRAGLMRTFQGNRIFGTLTVGACLAIGLEAPRARAGRHDVGSLAADFGLEALLDRPVKDLPYGIQKILNLAMVAASRPRVLLLDEPFAGVHADGVERLSAVIDDFRTAGVAVGVVEHNIAALMRIADDVVVLDSGRLIFRGTPTEAEVSPVVREAYLGASAARGGAA